MAGSQDDLKGKLSRAREIKISVVGRKSGATISIPIWFVLEDDKLHLLPVGGSDTQWFKNLEHNRSVGINSGGAEARFKARLVRDSAAVKSVAEKFREKYGAADVKKYYSKFDVAVLVKLNEPASAAA